MKDTSLSIEQLLEIEEKLEKGAVTEAVNRYYRRLQDATDTSVFDPEMKLISDNVPALAKAIEADMTGKGPVKAERRKAYGEIPAEELAVITIRHCFNHTLGQETIQTICIKLADHIRFHKDDKRFAEDFGAYRSVVLRSIKSSHLGHRTKVMNHVRHKMGVEDTSWAKDEKMKIGKALIDAFCISSGLFSIENYKKQGKRHYSTKHRKGVVSEGVTLMPSKWVTDWLEKNHKRCSILTPIFKPMVVPPVAWTSPMNGGYVSGKFTDSYQQCRLIRGQTKVELKAKQGRIDPQVYEAVNSLQSTPYRINERVLDVVEELKMSGLAGLPDGKEPKLSIPDPPWGHLQDDAFEAYKEANPEKVKKWSADAHRKHQEYWDEKSQRTSLLEKLRLGDMFRKYPAIYFPYNLDWRGRAYTMSTPTLSPQGDDPSKGMLEFADGQIVTDAGLRELRIHGANVHGEDKLSEKDRVGWVLKHTGYILEVEENPFGEAQIEFWTKADKPFQFLAFCFDYAGFLKNPATHKSHLICHIDQTCSGLQHWSAVLRDAEGAAQVGMVDKPMPDDIYQAVADKVEELIASDNDPLASTWRGKVTRAITKRNVMTKLYGATMNGMRDQVVSELGHLDKKVDGEGRYLEDCQDDNFKAGKYISEFNNKAMAEIVAKATQGMDYVQNVTKLMANDGKSTCWRSPIGLPIIQTYWKTNTKRIDTFWLSVKVSTVCDYKAYKGGRKTTNLKFDCPEKGIQVGKATNSIAPNFIHSMDGSHLLFIALNWKGKALTTVHDSFGTHCNDIPELHKVVRRTFIDMYENEDHLYNFARENAAQMGETAEVERPAMGNMDFAKILDATYFCR